MIHGQTLEHILHSLTQPERIVHGPCCSRLFDSAEASLHSLYVVRRTLAATTAQVTSSRKFLLQQMVDQGAEDAPIPPVSRFSTSTSLRMSNASQTRPPVVPMPRWSNAIGCARAVIAILVLAFTAASTGIWGGFPAFGIALFTASATLIVFAYYFIALSRKPALYNRWAILALEVCGTLFWLVSFALLARWTSFYHRFWYGHGQSYGFWHAPFRPSDMGLSPDMGPSPRSIVKRASSTRRAGVALAGTAAGLGGVEFILFCITLTVFGMALHRQRVAGAGQAGTTTTPATAPVSASTPVTEEEKVGETTLSKPEPVAV